MSRQDVVIIGAGLSGLCCARRLHTAGVACTILEASDGIGGRVRTDEVDGFALDRGFQVLLTAYPECRAVLDYDALDLRPLEPGALVRIGGRLRRLADPWRRPSHALASLLSPAATLGDKLRVTRLRRRLRHRDLGTIFGSDELSTSDYLRREGFSETIIERFFRPFLGGVFLDPELVTSSRMFEFVFKMFAEGEVALPAAGMQAIPRSLASTLPAGWIATGCEVARVEGTRCVLTTGEEWLANCVVLATDADSAARLAGAGRSLRWQPTACLYFNAPEPPVNEPILVLNGEGRGPINSLCVPSLVAPAYAPAGRSLVSVSLFGANATAIDAREPDVRRQLSEWFGPCVQEWRYLRGYAINRALPSQPPGALDPAQRPVRVREGLYVCGDHVDNSSIQGAMVSGRRAAEAVLTALGARSTGPSR